ncbi:MAG: hypothetical protein ACRCWL_00125, partial [Aeromonas sp.]
MENVSKCKVLHGKDFLSWVRILGYWGGTYPSPGTITLNGGLLQVLWLAIGSFFWRRTRVVAVPAVKVIYDQKQ